MHSGWFWVYRGPPCREILHIVLMHKTRTGRCEGMNLLSVQCIHLSGMLYFHTRLLPRPVQHLFSGEEMAQALLKASPHLFLFFQLRTVPSAFRRKTWLNYTDFHGPFWSFQTHDSWPCLPNSRNWLQCLTPVLLFPVYISRLLPCSYLLNHLCQASWAECGVPWALLKHLSQTAILVAHCACSFALPPNSH